LKRSVAERTQLVQDIWDGIAAEADALTWTEDQHGELDREPG
jgi:putative addiction module component (TIGR02574 family)